MSRTPGFVDGAEGDDKGTRRPNPIDVHVGSRVRFRRMLLGMSQEKLGEKLGLTFQQVQKYEKGINRIAAGRLFTIAQALGVDVSYFYEGQDKAFSFEPTPQQRMLLELARNFTALPSRKHQEAVCQLARAMSQVENGEDVTIEAAEAG